MIYVLVKNATVSTARALPPFTADIGIYGEQARPDRRGRREIQIAGHINDLGDLRTDGALRTIDATGLVAAPLFEPPSRRGRS